MPENSTTQRWLGAKNLVADGVEQGSRLVERSQRSVARRLFSVLGALSGRDEEVRRYEDAIWLLFAAGHLNVRLVSRLISVALDAAHQLAEPALRDDGCQAAPIALRSDAVGSAPWLWDGFIGVVNGIVGDHLAATDNPLAIHMRLRLGDNFVQPTADALVNLLGPEPPRLAIFVHGLSTTEWSWAWDAELQQGAADVTYGSLLADELGFVPVYVRYNSGLHISHNGRQLADLLQALVGALPTPPQEIAFVGHSMGGLVAYSAAHYGRQCKHGWLTHLRHVVSIAAPHDGAPLEKLGNLATSVLGAFDTPGTRIPAEVGDARSAGIKDLRHGYVVDEAWQGRDPDALVGDGRTHSHWIDGVRYHRIVATVSEDPAHPMGQLVGDTMVRPQSAAATNPVHALGNHPGEVAVIGGISHVGLANHPQVYKHLRRWLAEAE